MITLHYTSMHARSVHWWPLTVLKRCMSLCTHKYLATKIKLVLIQKFRHALTHPKILAKMIHYKPTDNKQRAPRDPNTCNMQNWLVVGFHPAWETQIPRAASSISNDRNLQLLWSRAFSHSRWQSAPRIRVSWSNLLPNLFEKIQRIANSPRAV